MKCPNCNVDFYYLGKNKKKKVHSSAYLRLCCTYKIIRLPIVGTNANLYFPSERSNEPLVIGCVRKNGSSSEKFSNVNFNRKYFYE